MKKTIIRLLTATLPVKPLRKLYIAYARALSWFKYGDSKFPRIITIEICGHCNRSCAYCPNVVTPQPAQLIKEETFNKIVQRLGEIRFSGVVDFIFFNEPCLNKSLPDYVRRVKAACPGAIPRISTNGDLLTSGLVTKLVNAGMDRIYVMRHNPTPEGWRERLAALSAEFPGIFVLMDIDKLEATDGLHDFNGLVEVKKHRGRTIIDGKARCQIHRHTAQILLDGSWNLCCVDYAKSKTFGNLLDNSIMEIWKDPDFVKARRLLESGVPITKTCTTCTCLVERKPEHRHPLFIPRATVEASWH